MSFGIEWIRQSAVMNSNGQNGSQSIISDSSGNIYVAYTSDGSVSSGTNKGRLDVVVFKMNTNGNVVWIKQQ